MKYRSGQGKAFDLSVNMENIEYLKIAQEIGDRSVEGAAYGNLGSAYRSLGDYQKGIEYHEKRLKIAQEIGDRSGEGAAYGNLGNTYLLTG